MAEDGAAIIGRYEKLVNERRPRDAVWEAVAPFVAPSRAGITSPLQPGMKITKDVYDDTGTYCAGILGKFMCGSMHNAASRWGRLTHRNPTLKKNDEFREWADESTDRMLAAFNRSNYYSEVYQMDIDWCGFGTGSKLTQELPLSEQLRRGSRGGLLFESDRIGRYVIAEDATGRVNTHMREFEYTANQAKERWREEKLPENIRRCLQSNKGDEKFSFVHAVYPRAESASRTYSGAKGMPWASCFIEKSTKTLVSEGGFREFPFMVPRWEKVPGWAYGLGPGELCDPNLKTLNAAKRLGFEDWGLKIRPPILHKHDAIFGEWSLIPGGGMPVNTGGHTIAEVVQAFQTGSHPEVSQIKEEEIRKQIRQAFYVDQILMMMEIDKAQMTAYEFQQKMQLLYQILAPIYGQYRSDYLNHLWDVSFAILYRQSAFSPPPDILYEYEDGGDLDVEFDSPLARAQRMEDITNMQMALGDIAPLAKFQADSGQEVTVVDKINVDKWADLIFERRGVPGSVTNNEDEIAALRQARAETKAALQERADAAALAQGAGQVAPMLKVLQGGKAA